MTDMEERVARLDTMIAEDRIVRQQWTDGHERACLLAALSPEAGRAGDASACPAYVMPPWLAHMTPWIDDEVSAHAWPGVIRRYAALARRWSALDDAAWERARIASLIAIVGEARLHCPADEVRALSAIDAVLEWLRRGAPESERVAVRDAAAWAAARAVVLATRAATKATRAAARAAWAGEAAAASAASVAAAAARAASSAAASARARAAASGRIAAAVLDAIEAEIERSER
jgi:hypothetical protein